MSWINSRQFQISNRNGRHYVFRRNNAGNTEINIPRNITTKAQAVAWLKAHPNKVAKPNRYRAKGARRGRAPAAHNKERLIPYKNTQGRLFYRRLLPGQRPPPLQVRPTTSPTPAAGWVEVSGATNRWPPIQKVAKYARR